MNTSARGRAAGTQTRAPPGPASRAAASVPAGPRPVSSLAVHGLTSAPPIAMRKSGRFESRSSAPYRGPSAREHVAVTPAAASAATSAPTPVRQPAASPGSPSPGTITSATPAAQVWPPAATRTVLLRPNHSQAGLSRV